MDRRSFLTMSMIGAGIVYLPMIGDARAPNAEIVVTPATFASVISGTSGAPLGSIFVLQPGDYDAPPGTAWLCNLIGTLSATYTFRGQPGVRIGPISIAGAYTTWEDCEFAYTGWTTRTSSVPGSNPPGVFYWARFLIYGKGSIIRRCVIHDVADVNWGVGASDSVFEDCLTYNIGFDASDRGHGHGFYIQNDTTGPKTMRRCVSVLAYATPCKIYGVNAKLEDIHIEDSVFAFGRAAYTYVRSDNSAAHTITIKNLLTYGLQWNHSNFLAGGGPISVDGGVIVTDVPEHAYSANNWQAGITVRNLMMVGHRMIAYWRDAMPLAWIDTSAYHTLPPVAQDAPWATFAPNAGILYHNLAEWQAATGNDTHATYRTVMPDAPRIDVIERSRDHVVVIYNWHGEKALPAPLRGTYRNALNPHETRTVMAGDLLPMDVWTAATPIGASAPIMAYDIRFGAFVVEANLCR